MTRKAATDLLMKECYLAYWSPQAVSHEGPGQPSVSEATRAIVHPVTGKCGVNRRTLFKARKWAESRGLPVRALRCRKLDPVTALAMCLECFGDETEMDKTRSVEKIARSYGSSKSRAYRTYRPLFESGELHKMAAEHASKAARRPKSA